MKKVLFTFAILAPNLSFAHGQLAQQASDAIEVATEIFVSTQPQQVRSQFSSISATLTGHEQFAVFITLKDGTTKFTYNCVENEDVEPVIWECQSI